MAPWLTIAGVGEGGAADMTPAARAAVEGAEVVIGAERHLRMFPGAGRERLAWPRPFDPMIERLRALRGRRVCVLATGDPCWYGVGALLAGHFARDEVSILPAPSAFSLACARLGWRLEAVETLSLHGRPVESLHAWLSPGARLLALSRDGRTPAAAARLLAGCGYGPSRLVVLERLGGPRERLHEAVAAGWGERAVDDLNILAIECAAEGGTPLRPRTPGLPDDAFRHDGQLTKREARALTLAALAPLPGQRLWDVGAGCGSIAIEWMRAARGAQAVAIERDAARRALIAENAAALGVPGLDIVAGEAPAALTGLPVPDAVFVGGGLTGSGLLERCFEALAPGGRLVANAVSVEGEQALARAQVVLGGELVRLEVARSAPVGRYRGWRPLMPVTQLAAAKR